MAEHIYQGSCPDQVQPAARDPACPACAALDQAADALRVAFCPGCGEPLPVDNDGCCRACGYEDPDMGRILTIAEIIEQPSYPAKGAARYNDVCPAFIAAVVAAARAQQA